MKKQNSIHWTCFTVTHAVRLLKVLHTSGIIIQHRGETGRLVDSKNWSIKGAYPGYENDQVLWLKSKTLRMKECIIIRTP